MFAEACQSRLPQDWQTFRARFSASLGLLHHLRKLIVVQTFAINFFSTYLKNEFQKKIVEINNFRKFRSAINNCCSENNLNSNN